MRALGTKLTTDVTDLGSYLNMELRHEITCVKRMSIRRGLEMPSCVEATFEPTLPKEEQTD